jgi:putative tryptophan/tyrosine transport system substrate-binding protein
MRKTVIRFALSAVLFALCSSAHAQQPTKVPRVGFLETTTAASAVLMEAFQQEMRKLGWIEGKNFTIEYRFAEGKFDRLPGLAADLVRLKVDLIVTTGRAPALAAKNASTTIPIVMMNFPDPVGEGLVASLARPGGNVTGFSSLSYELNTKRLEILKDAVPKLARVGVLQQGGTAPADLSVKELRAAALALKLKLEEIRAEADAKGFGKRVSNREAEADWRDCDQRWSHLSRRKKADRPACRQAPVSCYLSTEGVCR